MALEGQDVVVEAEERGQLHQVARGGQRDDRPGGGQAQGPPLRAPVQRARVAQGGNAARGRANPVGEYGRHGRTHGDHSEADVAALERVPLVAQDGHDRRPHCRAPRHVADHRHEDRGDEERRAVVQEAHVPEHEAPEERAGRQQAGEVAHGPRAPDRHALDGVEGQAQDERRNERDAERKVGNLPRLPAVQRPPHGEALRGVACEANQGLGEQQQHEGLVHEDALHPAGDG
mmetsp:Transcript_173611/g.422255  ORF Transcript_173611/g.422255 Transcript_173611/m.422255 type:complete len:232 (-) Transcript_173611:851-1546(-)